jgi:hypothetical protein
VAKPIHPKVAAVAITGATVTAIFALFHIGVDQPVAVLIAAVLSALAGYLKSA